MCTLFHTSLHTIFHMKNHYSLYAFVRTEKPDKFNKCQMYLRYTFKTYKLIPLELKIDKDMWNVDKREPRKNYPLREKVKEIIQNKLLETESLILNYKTSTGTYPSPSILMDLSNGIETKTTRDNYFDEFVKYQKFTKFIEQATIDTYNQTKEKLKQYLINWNIDWEWRKIDLKFYEGFISYMGSIPLKLGTQGKHIKNLKTFLGYINENHRLVTYEQYKNFVTPDEDPDFTVLTERDKEIMKSHLSTSSILPNQTKLNEEEKENLRIMLILCYTGLNFEDLMDVKIDDIYDIKSIEDLDFNLSIYEKISADLYIKKPRKKLKKVDKKLIPIIPITHDLSDLLKMSFSYNEDNYISLSDTLEIKLASKDEKISLKNLWKLINDTNTSNIEERSNLLPTYPRLFKDFSNTVFNREIKLILKKIGLNEIVNIISNSGSNKIIETKSPKWKLVSTRTGRRTFITSSLAKGIPLNTVMRMVGIKKYDTVMRYDNISDLHIVKTMKEINPKPTINVKINSNET